MNKGVKVALFFVFLFSATVGALAQETDQDFKGELDQETHQQQKQEAQKPDTKASAGDLAKVVQNPVASLISVPLQNFTDFNIGPFARDRNTVIQFQPVVPFQLSENWNLITRTIGALVYQSNFAQLQQGTFGFGDLNPSFFLSPAKAGKIIWGVDRHFSGLLLRTTFLAPGNSVLGLLSSR